MEWSTLLWVVVVDFGIQWAGAAVAIALQTEKFYDLTGSATYLLLVVWAVAAAAGRAFAGEVVALRSVVLPFFVGVWCVRLGLFLVQRVVEAGEDKRFHAAKQQPPLMFFYWTMQGVWVLVTSLPVLAVTILRPDAPQPPLSAVDVAGWAVWGCGFALEVVADRQKEAFRRRRSQPSYGGKGWISEGVWRWSQHPNYCGEIALWWGVWLSCGEALPLVWWLACAASPLFLTFLITRVSGIPLLRKAALERWGDDPEYMAYRANTSLLIPMPPASKKAA